jgi:Ion transport protein
LVIFLGGILMLVRTANISNHLSNPLELGATWESYAFVSCKILRINGLCCDYIVFVDICTVYALEMTLKMFGLGLHRYFTSGWNLFDFIVTVVSFLGLIAEILGHFPFLIVVRHLR